jgi:hypothetical protein
MATLYTLFIAFVVIAFVFMGLVYVALPLMIGCVEATGFVRRLSGRQRIMLGIVLVYALAPVLIAAVRVVS